MIGRELEKFVWSLAEHHDVAPFCRVVEYERTKNIRVMTDSLLCAHFKLHFKFVAWLTEWIESLSDWIGTCKCHSDVWASGKKITC